MPTGVFPHPGYFGATKETGASRFTRVFEDGTYRTVLRSTPKWERLVLPVQRLTETERNTLETFHYSHITATTQAAFEFYVYDPFIPGTVFDPAGSLSTGKRTGIFIDEHLQWTIEAGCLFSTQVTIHIPSS